LSEFARADRGASTVTYVYRRDPKDAGSQGTQILSLAPAQGSGASGLQR